MNPGSTVTYTYSAATVASPNAVYVHPLAGGGNVSGSPTDLSSTDFTNGTKRWTSARTLALGIRVFPTGQ